MMKKFFKYFIFSFFTLCFSYSNAQTYCLKFSKEGKKDFVLSEGKNISFVLDYTGNWNKGRIIKITADSLFIEQYIAKQDLLSERENNYEVRGYGLTDFNRIAFRKTSKVIEGSALLIVYVATFVITSGMVLPAEEEGEPGRKIFQKNINFNDDWKAEVISCVIN